MRFSTLSIFTHKEDPKDALLKSHKILLRANFIQQVGSGLYSLSFLGLRVMEKIKAIVKEEMEAIGAQEVQLSFITPLEYWQASKRDEVYGEELLRFKDRHGASFVLGPTHEELALELISAGVKSYKQMPQHIFQIHTKFRDERRPRFGLMRAREFIMKDGYSFHATASDLDREFNAVEGAYKKMLNRLNLDYRVVEADSGAIGGNASKEFMILLNNSKGAEDEICYCPNGDYASNLEVANTILPPNLDVPKAQFAKFYTKDVRTIADLSDFLHVDPYFLVKTVIKKIVFSSSAKVPSGGGSNLAFFFIRGCDNLEDIKALNVLKRSQRGSEALELLDASEEEIMELGLNPDSIGPYSLASIAPNAFIYFDNSLKGANGLICGANERDYHFVGVDLSTFTKLDFSDLRRAKPGDLCPLCNSPLIFSKTVEMAHIFKLQDRYSRAMDIGFLDELGRKQYFLMGCYGIGITRLLSAILEQKADERGAIWGNVAPFSIVIIVSNVKEEHQLTLATTIYSAMLDEKVEVILDDRNVRFGNKIKDFELIGFKNALILGQQLENNNVEFIKRDGLTKTNIKIDNIKEAIRTIIELI